MSISRVFATAVALVVAGTLTIGTAAPAPALAPSREDADLLLGLVNQERTAAGLAPLTGRADVADVASAHAQVMAATSNLFHNPDFLTAATRALFGAKAMGENVAVNTTVEGAHSRLMASPGHRANVLDARFDGAGFAVVRTPEGQVWITQNFVQSGKAPVVAKPVADPTPPSPAPSPVPPAAATATPAQPRPAAPASRPAVRPPSTTSSTAVPAGAAVPTPMPDPASVAPGHPLDSAAPAALVAGAPSARPGPSPTEAAAIVLLAGVMGATAGAIARGRRARVDQGSKA